MKKEDKSSIKSKIYSYFNYVLVLFAILFLLSLYKDFAKIKAVGLKVQQKEEEVKDLEKKRDELKADLEKTKSDEYIEKQFRDKLNMAKVGETVLILPPDDVIRKYALNFEEEPETLPDPNWKMWLHLFL